MAVTSRDRVDMIGDLASTRLSSRHIAAVVPMLVECTSPGCGFDELNNSGIDPACEFCDGLGRTATFAISRLYANVRHVDQALLTFGQVPPGAQVGDTFLTVNPRDLLTMQACLNNQDAYFFIDGHAFRPTAIQVAGLGQIEEYVVVVQSYQPLWRAAGY